MSSALPRLARLGFSLAARSAAVPAGATGFVGLTATTTPGISTFRSHAGPLAWRTMCTEGAKEAPKVEQSSGGITAFRLVLLGGLAGSAAYAYTLFSSGGTLPQQGALNESKEAAPAPPPKPVVKDYGAVRKAIADVLEKDGYDDGSYGPILVRLAWHASGTFDKNSGTGGSPGATMRFSPECDHAANAGLAVGRAVLEPIKKQFPWISYGDLWTLAGVVAVEEMAGPTVPWRAGRIDKPDGTHCPPDGRLPDAAKAADHVRDVFYRMGFDDKEIVALLGAHSLGRCHPDRSGYSGPWTNAPTTFSNLYYQELLNQKWTKKKWNGPEQYEDKSGELMMTPADMSLVWDKKFKKIVQQYAKDQDVFFKDFAAAFSKLLELGLPASATA